MNAKEHRERKRNVCEEEKQEADDDNVYSVYLYHTYV